MDCPDAAPAIVMLAHGAWAPMDSPFMAAIAGGLAQKGWRVGRFGCPYMARQRETGRRRAPDRLQVLQASFRQQVHLEQTDFQERPLMLAGKSMGGRVASLVVHELADGENGRGCVCLGYPFHRPGRPEQLRIEHLLFLRTPTPILQGERDSFGGGEEVESYTLSPQAQLGWIPSGDHSFKPPRSSGLSEAEYWATAMALSDGSLRQVLDYGGVEAPADPPHGARGLACGVAAAGADLPRR